MHVQNIRGDRFGKCTEIIYETVQSTVFLVFLVKTLKTCFNKVLCNIHFSHQNKQKGVFLRLQINAHKSISSNTTMKIAITSEV